MLTWVFLAVAVVAGGFTIYYLFKKALKITLFIVCIGVAFVALKYFLGVI